MWFRRKDDGSRWVHPDNHRIVKLLPSEPPSRGEHVLVDGVRHRVLRCPVKWQGNTWSMADERGIKVIPDSLPDWMM